VRVLCLGGGGLRAAFQVPILERLVPSNRYDLIMGISAGAVNGAFAAQGDLEALRPDWEAATARSSIGGVPGVFSVSRHPWHYVYSLAPLHDRLRTSISLSRLRVPFACGVVVRETHQYRLLDASDMSDDAQLHAAIIASGSIAGLMPPVHFRDDSGTASLYDGGHRHSLPPIPATRLGDVTDADAVLTSPISRPDPPGPHGGLPQAMLWVFENQIDIAKRLDLDYLEALSRDRHIAVRVFAPDGPLGGMFDGRSAMVRRRLEAGEAALHHPLEL
jgi:predicted acylesterase/phospholipase RssA